MSEEEDRQTLSIQLANQVINMANNRLQEGMNPVDIAAGLRHAAANFSAFAIANSEKPDEIDPTFFAEEFLQIYAYYLEKHTAPVQQKSGLEALVNQVRDEN
ncbi:DUF3144 domain-containing protein [Thalassospiraceae bacterium LMO-JJ14]|nr:DUF3144 domain-containing protein [Thalassospiraceae bacterium LMO-JJ14]